MEQKTVILSENFEKNKKYLNTYLIIQMFL
jgi:hypothetical protein